LIYLKGHTSPVHVAFNPDAKRVASGDCTEGVKIWDWATGKELVPIENGDGVGVAFSPDGRRLASGSGDIVKIWDSATGKELVSCMGRVGVDVKSLAFS